MNLSIIKPYIELLDKDEKSSNGLRAIAAYEMLLSSDLMIESYLKSSPATQGQILLNVFGLLQSLFVAIDALYDLSIGLTKYKYHININANPKLHELKFIRNDIVGHPTHRSYSDGGIGFSMFDQHSLSLKKITYQTYIYTKNNLDIKTTHVEFEPLIEAYHEERVHLIDGLYAFLNKAEGETELPEKIYKLFETLNLELLHEVKASFISRYQISQTVRHRFIWRAELLELLIGWHEKDDQLNEMILYMAKIQAIKMYDIALDLENRKQKSLYQRLPNILIRFYRFVSQNESTVLPLLSHIHDFMHPLFESDLDHLVKMDAHRDVKKLLEWFNQIDDGNKIYLIGSQLKSYRVKK